MSPAGAVELPLSCAQILDPDNVGLEHWLVGLPSNDLRQEFSDRRMRCYELVLDSLNVFEEKSGQAVGAGAIDDPETVRTHAYELAFASPDEMFHSTLYDWLINRGLADELLEVRFIILDSKQSADECGNRCTQPILKPICDESL